VFPEALGHLVPLALGPAAARRARTVDEAIAVAAVRRPLAVARGFFGARTPSPRHAVLLALAPDADRWMRDTFAAIARRHRATVVAGSHLRVRGDGSIANSSYTFDAGGRLAATTDKVNLVPQLEDRSRGGLGLARGAPDGVAPLDQPWGRLATLICYDGFAEPHTRHERFVRVAPRLDAAGVDVLANPAANPWPWTLGWVHADPGESLTRAEQWQREGLPATMATLRHVRWGVTAHLVARVLDLRFEGVSEILHREGDEVTAVARAPCHDRGAVVSAIVDLSVRSSHDRHAAQ
jgi:predicted amidohydrolase